MHASNRLNRRKLFAALAAAFGVPATMIAQEAVLIPPDVKRVGARLACLCGTCKNSVGDCQMPQCGYSSPAREKIARLLKEGKSDDEIVATFVKDVGKHALSAPPAEGFSLTAWLMPIAFGALGALFIVWYLQQEKKKALAPVSEVDPAVLDKYHSKIEKEMADLD